MIGLLIYFFLSLLFLTVIGFLMLFLLPVLVGTGILNRLIRPMPERKTETREGTADMRACSVCGRYVLTDNPQGCNRGVCPYS